MKLLLFPKKMNEGIEKWWRADNSRMRKNTFYEKGNKDDPV